MPNEDDGGTLYRQAAQSVGIPPLTDQDLRDAYWQAHAQFGPFDVTPAEFISLVRAGEVKRKCESDAG